ncbi:protein takeout-like [Diabrotica virgifera virgifera]|uniref:Protein takeout-like n=1 Tax=Diabrotica virgifera virgifera TaxID=50390 RepID=A0A6P7H845_DIAVI|nr:protein takeout-like [Diabrotica virgifera virgifera]
MTRFFICAIICLFANVVIASKSLPSYITPCKKTDPKLSECAKQRAIEALPSLIKGDRAYKIPSFDPYVIPAVETSGTSGINLNLKNLRLSGLDTTVIRAVKVDLKNNQIVVDVFIPETRTEADYTVAGKLFAIDINGEGPASIRGENSSVICTVDYKLITKKDGKRYVDPDTLKSHLDLNVDKTHYHFGNLFGGNKVLEDSFNNVLNENSKEVDDISKETNRSIVSSIVVTVLKSIFRVPFDDIFVD